MDREAFQKKYLKPSTENPEQEIIKFYADLDEVIQRENNIIVDKADFGLLKADYHRMYLEAMEGGNKAAADLIVTYVKTIDVYRMDRIASKDDPPRLIDFVKWGKEFHPGLLAQTMCDLENWDLKEFKKKKSLRLTLNNWMTRSKTRMPRGNFNPPMIEA